MNSDNPMPPNHAGSQEPLVSVDGKILLGSQAVVPAFDQGFLYANSVFTTMTAFGTHILDRQGHLNRLQIYAEARGLLPESVDHIFGPTLEFELDSMLEQRPEWAKKMIRIMITGGDGALRSSKPPKPRRIIYVQPAPFEKLDAFNSGLSLSKTPRNYNQRLGFIKSPSLYAEAVPLLHKLSAKNFDDLLWTNADGEICEASSSNIFFIGRNGDLLDIVTPAANSGLLEGLTRGRILNLLESAKIKAESRIIYTDELPRFDEAFLTSSVRGLVPVIRVDQQRFHTARESSVYRHILRLFNTWVATELGHYVDWNSGQKIERPA